MSRRRYSSPDPRSPNRFPKMPRREKPRLPFQPPPPPADDTPGNVLNLSPTQAPD